MRIDKFKEKNNKKRLMTFAVALGVMCAGGGYLINKSYANYQESVSFKVMEGTVQYEGSGDVFFTFYKGDTVLDSMPPKDNVDNLVFEHGECDKEAYILWNRVKWAPIVVNLGESKTKCNLYFRDKNYIEKLADINTTDLVYDETDDSNLRYIGASPKNYIDIGDIDSNNKPILWRIIGIMNNMTIINDDGSENFGQSLVKIIRADSIGAWSWDTSASGVNNGYGVNEWSESDIMTTLNDGAYWNKESGQCYNNSNDKQGICNFSSIGLTESVKEKIVKVRWNTGTIPERIDISSTENKLTVGYMYEGERSENHGKMFCSDKGTTYGKYCNDNVSRTTTWDGYIGLMYPSDYGYAVGGSQREKLLATSVYNWNGSGMDYIGNDWLRDSSNYQWTITPIHSLYGAYSVYSIDSNGVYGINSSSTAYVIRPTAYLNSNIKIKENSTSNYGSQNNPFVLES